MNENVDLTKILENCPEGWEFWSDNYGKVLFKYIDKNFDDSPIFVKRADGYTAAYTKEGWCNINLPANCLLWPSKDCRDWSKFSAPWYKKEKFDPKTLQPFDKVLVRDINNDTWGCSLFSHIIKRESFPYRCVGSSYTYCVPYNEDTKHLIGTTDEAPEYYRYLED